MSTATPEQLMDRIQRLRKERDYLQDLLKACQIAGWLPVALDRVVNNATAEESEDDIARRRDNAQRIIEKSLQV